LTTVDELCPHCDNEVEIPDDRPSECPSCGVEIIPCASCPRIYSLDGQPRITNQECDWREDIRCTRFLNKEKFREIIETRLRETKIGKEGDYTVEINDEGNIMIYDRCGSLLHHGLNFYGGVNLYDKAQSTLRKILHPFNFFAEMVNAEAIGIYHI
jgi:predicted RNA-binding Zn-ribbon protein involved in translation (DUF1610 family)|tara:strand:- start:9843 stop:10310 length:468 start_codon:yes stop_codon:yes gene_type:complete